MTASATSHSLSMKLVELLREIAMCGVSQVSTPPGNVRRATPMPLVEPLGLISPQ